VTKDLAGHNGKHPRYLEAAANLQEELGTILEQVRDFLCRNKLLSASVGQQRRKTEFCIVCECDSGRHRSVTAATLLAALFRSHLGFRTTVRHLELPPLKPAGGKSRWNHDDLACPDCCAQDPGVQDAVYQAVVRLWETLPDVR
jgi:hypothetical protein